jgi:general secretion pathway protein G
MVIVLVILSLLAMIAAPYAQKSFQREKELQLRDTLRTVRKAIDEFHADWAQNQNGGDANASGAASASFSPSSWASANGYPLSLQVLADGVEKPIGSGKHKRYLRNLPLNPFSPAGTPLSEQWTFASSGQEGAPQIAASSYGTTLTEAQRKKGDIYDLHAKTQRIALDGTPYAGW